VALNKMDLPEVEAKWEKLKEQLSDRDTRIFMPFLLSRIRELDLSFIGLRSYWKKLRNMNTE